MAAGVAGYCRKNDLVGTDIQISLEVETNPETKLMSKLIYSFSFPAEFPEEHREALRANAENCYVKRHLFTPPEVIVDIKN